MHIENHIHAYIRVIPVEYRYIFTPDMNFCPEETFYWWPSWLGLQNTSTGSLQRSKPPHHECPRYHSIYCIIQSFQFSSFIKEYSLTYKFMRSFVSLMSRVFANGLGDQDSVPGRVIPKTQKMVLDAILLNTQYYKVCIKGKVEQSMEWSSALPDTLV